MSTQFVDRVRMFFQIFVGATIVSIVLCTANVIFPGHSWILTTAIIWFIAGVLTASIYPLIPSDPNSVIDITMPDSAAILFVTGCLAPIFVIYVIVIAVLTLKHYGRKVSKRKIS